MVSFLFFQFLFIYFVSVGLIRLLWFEGMVRVYNQNEQTTSNTIQRDNFINFF